MAGREDKATKAMRFTALTLLAVCLADGPAEAVYTTMVNNGPSANRVDIVFLGDGYTAAQISTTYVTHVQAMLTHLFDQTEDPFPRYRNFFNVHRIDVVSNQSGADVPPQGISRDTALDASYYWDGSTDRLLYINETKANSQLSTGLAGAGFTAEMKLITVNDTRYGGGGGTYAVYAGGNSSAPEIALHELGHSFSNLADEYDYGSGTYTGPERPEANVSIYADSRKWSQWLGYVDPAHTSMGAVGAYQGAYYQKYGIYRPTSDSKMRTLGKPFNAVSREKIILDIYKYCDPLDSWLANQATLTNPNDLWVDVVDPDIIKLQWSVDGQLVSGAAAEHFTPTNLTVGTHTITARAYDDTPWVRTSLDSLQQTVTWSVTVTPSLFVWTGGGATSDWSVSANWGGAAPPAGNHLAFAGSQRLTNNNNIASRTSFASLTFQSTAGAFVLGGNSIELSGPITNQSTSPQSIDNNIEFTASGDINAQNGDITLSGEISGSVGLTKKGTGKVVITQDAAYSGNTIVAAGTLDLVGLSNAGSTTVNGTLIADYIRQESLTIIAGGKVSIDGSGTSVVNFLNIADSSGNFSWGTGGGGSSDKLNVIAVPEPATWLLAIMAASAGFVAWRRRKR